MGFYHHLTRLVHLWLLLVVIPAKCELERCSADLYPKSTEGQFIVRFREYRLARQWKVELECSLGKQSFQWHWIERDNAAAAFPTDFGVLRLSILTSTFLINKLLQNNALVKDIHLDRILRRDLTMKSEDHEQDAFTKPPGRFRTRSTIGLDKEDDYHYDEDSHEELKRHLLYHSYSSTQMSKTEAIWDQGFTGKGIRVGVFDTGIAENHPHVRNIKERTNWTHQKTLSDGLGHGSFVAGVIAGSYSGCLGFAPDVELYTFKVFTDDQVSYTSWFLDAFNYAILCDLTLVNLSIGGPDYLDEPFVEKILEVTSSGIIMLSAIGNDGPLYGTLNNPADQNDVIGVGGVTYEDKIARFSSRGMSTWELPLGYGRIKPDVVAYAQDVFGSKIDSGCRALSGTSVASPVAAGAVALLSSTLPEDTRTEILNPSSMKQALIEGAERVSDASIYIQGAGKINLENSMNILQSYKPRASLVPNAIDLTDCPYMWPFCTQPIYANAVPLVMNATILNGMGVTGVIHDTPRFIPSDKGGELLVFDFEYGDVLWPWSGYLVLYVRVKPSGLTFEGVASGQIQFSVKSPPPLGKQGEQISFVEVPFKVEIIPTPPRQKRILWDQFHSIKYPPGYFPRDNLDSQRDILDWHGDHPHTNFHDMYNNLRENGYFLEILNSPFTCFNASQYGALMIVDSEDAFYPEEIEKLKSDVNEEGLGLIVLAEWHNEAIAKSFNFFDDNTRSWWTPVCGGGNIPALNDLLSSFDIAFGEAVLKGEVRIENIRVKYASGANVIRFPEGGYLHEFPLKDSATEISDGPYYALGLVEQGKGRIVVYGDSNCLDSSYQTDHCFDLLKAMLNFVLHEKPISVLNELLKEDKKLSSPLDSAELPKMLSNIRFEDYSFVLTHPLQCYKNSPNADFTKLESSSESKRNVSNKIWTENEPESVHVTEATPKMFKVESVDQNIVFKPNRDFTFRAPPLLFSKWTAMFGILAMYALFKYSRRRRVASVARNRAKS